MKKKIFFYVAVVVASLVNIHSCKKGGDTPEGGTPTAVGVPVGSPTTMNIDATGGTITSADSRIDVIFPAGALSSSTLISIQPDSNTAFEGLGLGYDLGPEGLTFNQNFTIRFHYDSNDIAGGNIHTLGIAYQDSDHIWYSYETVILDSVAQTLSVITNHFSPNIKYNEFRCIPPTATVMVKKTQMLALKEVRFGHVITKRGIHYYPITGSRLVSPGSLVTWQLITPYQGPDNDGTISPHNNSATTVYTAPNSVKTMSNYQVHVVASYDASTVTGNDYFSTITVKEGNTYHMAIDLNIDNVDFGPCLEASYHDHAKFDVYADSIGYVHLLGDLSTIQNFTPDGVSYVGHTHDNTVYTCSNTDDGDEFKFTGVLDNSYIQQGSLSLVGTYTSLKADVTYSDPANNSSTAGGGPAAQHLFSIIMPVGTQPTSKNIVSTDAITGGTTTWTVTATPF